MSGIGILRRKGAIVAPREVGARDKHAARRSAFEANLALQLEQALGGYATLRDVEAVTKALGEAYLKTTHAVDARTSVRLGVRRYFVLQTGWAPTTGDYRIDALDPFSAKLLSRLPTEAAVQVEPKLKAIGDALGKTEISRRHDLDWRLRMNTPWVRFYVNFLSGRDKRSQTLNVSHDRRKPVDENFGLCVLLAIAGMLSLLGASLIVGTLWAFADLMMTQGGRATLSSLFDASIACLTSCFSALKWLN